VKSSARRAALTALKTWRSKTLFADSIVSRLFGETNLTAQDRAFTLELFYGVLRNLTLLDFWVSFLRSSRVEADLRDILRLGLYQLFLLETSDHAAVYETVELAKKKHRSLINGILRSASRRKDELAKEAEAQPIEIRTSHPNFLVARWERNFGTAATEILCAWNNKPPPLYARINSLRIDRDAFLRDSPGSRPLAGRAQFVELHSLQTPALAGGHCYIQDPSTAVPCELLDPKPDEKILDACAAPGGKTSYIAQLMQNRGAIVACDRDPQRIEVLQENLARLGVEIARTFPCDWTRQHVAEAIASLGPFDRILIDAPCSNTGAIRRRVDVRWRLTPADFQRMQRRQIEIARAIFPLLKTGGVLVYSTCSLEPEENKEVVRHLLTNMPILRLEEEKLSLPFRDHFDGAFAAKFIKTG